MHEYYAYVDKIDDLPEKLDVSTVLHLEFHCLETKSSDSMLKKGVREVHEALNYAVNTIITLTISYGRLIEIFLVENPFYTECNWYLLATSSDGNGVPATSYEESNIADNGTPVFINSISEIPEERPSKRLLDEKISFDIYPDADISEIESLLEKQNITQQAEFVAAYNVGHGNCNAICNSLSIPLLYFDLGGGCAANKKTYSKCLHFCFTMKPPIILSHWDLDHFQSAKLDSTYLTKNWIVPRQKPSNIHLKFFGSITGKRLIWPLGNATTFTWGTIGYCIGTLKKKNDTGLALSLTLTPSANLIDTVLLPADAAYKHIPFQLDSYKGLIATHHGAEYVANNHPTVLATSAVPGALALSFGSDNTYDHPRTPAVIAHKAAGWSSMRETNKGHIALCSIVTHLACANTRCNLSLLQHF